MADILSAISLSPLSSVSIVAILVAGFSGIVRFQQLPSSLRYLAALTIFELPLELLGFWLMLVQHNNLFLMPIYTVGELVLLALLYKRTIRSATFSRVMPGIVGAFIVYVGFDSLLGPSLHWFRPGQQVVQSLLVLGMVGWYFWKLMSELRVRHLEQEPMFWVSTGLVIYFLGYLQIALFSNYLLRHYSAAFNRNVWAVEILLTIVLHSCYSLALWIRPRK
ncbi:hypothetical protein [Hymenobacter sp. BRD67]|uniref:hypothetical protein n=1 Tax=Hymenobacter sp. BRD67 TaxID=2675877 RepID=UPI001563E9CC|nr:hypothetical protein [Hymenobacter sp. BRD67]QKG54327.1 hypothetical protein GKZ67_19135 [Hymenobacter sp. BRD67]